MILLGKVILGGVILNVILLLVYFLLKKEMEKFSVVREKAVMVVRRARTSYLHWYGLAILVVVLSFFTPLLVQAILISLIIAFLFIVEIHHNSMRLVLTKNQIIQVKGLLNIHATAIEHQDVIMTQVSDYLIGGYLGYGDVQISIVGGKNFRFAKIQNYMEVKNFIQRTKILQERNK